MDLNKLFDYTDNFSETVRTTRPIRAEELTVRFFCAPQWIIALMKFRNAIVKPFGLKGEKNLSDIVIVESDSLATISKSDKHIDFEPVHMSGKRFKKCAGFLPNAHQKKFGKKIARYFYRFPVFPYRHKILPGI